MLRASEIEIHVDKPILMQSDGEGFTSNHVQITTGPYKLPLIVEIPDRHGTGRKPNFITSYVNEAIGLKL